MSTKHNSAVTIAKHKTYLDLVVLSDGNGTNTVLLAQVLAERCTHDAASDVGGRVEMSLALLPSGRSNQLVHFSHFG